MTETTLSRSRRIGAWALVPLAVLATGCADQTPPKGDSWKIGIPALLLLAGAALVAWRIVRAVRAHPEDPRVGNASLALARLHAGVAVLLVLPWLFGVWVDTGLARAQWDSRFDEDLAKALGIVVTVAGLAAVAAATVAACVAAGLRRRLPWARGLSFVLPVTTVFLGAYFGYLTAALGLAGVALAWRAAEEERRYGFSGWLP